MKKFYLFVLIAMFVLTGCTSSGYKRIVETKPDKTIINTVEVHNTSIGMDREGIDISFAKGKKGDPGYVYGAVKVKKSNASESMGKVAEGMETMLEGIKEMNP